MDILGPLLLTYMGNNNILVILDQFTKWIECCVLPKQHAETIFIKIWFFLTDNTNQDDSISSSFNGQVKRYNHTLEQMIKCFTNKRQDSWDVHLQQLINAIRATENRL